MSWPRARLDSTLLLMKAWVGCDGRPLGVRVALGVGLPTNDREWPPRWCACRWDAAHAWRHKDSRRHKGRPRPARFVWLVVINWCCIRNTSSVRSCRSLEREGRSGSCGLKAHSLCVPHLYSTRVFRRVVFWAPCCLTFTWTICLLSLLSQVP